MIAASAPVPVPVAPPRSLAPREHGAYGQLATPLVAALAMGRPSLAALCLTVASVTAFIAHEPLLVVLGQRGARAQRNEAPRAKRALALLGGVTLLLGGAGLLLAPPAARFAALVPALLAAVVAVFVAREEEKTTAGELIAAAALSSAALPVALASKVAPMAAWGALGAWCLAFGAATLAVRAVIANQKAPRSWLRRVLPLLLPTAIAMALVWQGATTVYAIAPVLLLSFGLAAASPHPRMLRKVGWMLVASTIAMAGLLIAIARMA